MTFIEFLQSNGYDVDGDGNIVLFGTTDVQHQNVFSTQLEAWLASEHVFGSDAFAEWLEDALDDLVAAADLDGADRDAILALFAAGDYSIKLNQNSEEGAPYIEFAGYSFLTDLLDFESLFDDAASHTWTQGRAEQTRWYFDTFLLGQEQVELGLAFFPTQSGNSTDPVGLFYVTGSEEDFGFSVQVFQFDPDDEDGLGAPQAGITVDPDTGELSVAGNVDSDTYKVVVTAQDADGNETSLTFTLLLGTNGADTMPGANFVLDPDGNNILVGLGGADNLTGSDGVDYILGSQGNDGFTSSLGADWYHLGGNNDTIHFTDVLHSNPLAFDTIMDWGNGSNTINLSQIDADTTQAGNQAFAFAGQNEDVVANSITWYQAGSIAEGTAVTVIQGDVNGDTDADLMIVLLGHHPLAAGDFVMA